MREAVQNSVSLPFSLWSHPTKKEGFASQSQILFHSKSEFLIRNKEFEFVDGTLNKSSTIAAINHTNETSIFQEGTIPFFSLFAVLFLVIFRNRFFGSFQKYFLSLRNNYEIDFNFQKIGAVPVALALIIILLSAIDLTKLSLANKLLDQSPVGIQSVRLVLLIFLTPILSSLVLFFLLNLSLKLFPIIFSDLKVLFFLSLLSITYNFSSFGSKLETVLSLPIFLAILLALYFVLRSFLFYKIFLKSYRFKIPITVFYICTLNLQTFLLLTWGVFRDIFRLL